MNIHGFGEFDSQITGGLPPLGALRCFETAARHESFTLAAQELHLTHGAVSRAVRAIEDELGIALFERRNRRVFLTEAGRRLAEATQIAFNTIAVAARDLRRRGDRAPLVLSCDATLLTRWLIPALPEMQAEHPEIALQLAAAGGPVAFEREGIDCAIRRDDFVWPKNVVATPFMEEWVGPVCTPRMAARLGLPDRGAEALADANLLHSRTRPDAWPQWLEQQAPGLLAEASETFDHFYLTLQAAASGLGIAIGPYAMVRQDLESGALVAPFGFAKDRSSYCLLVPSSRTGDARIATMLSWLARKVARDLSMLTDTGGWRMAGGFKDHFSSHAAGYALYRPTYPSAVSSYLAELAPGQGLALDCGCGAGQLSTCLADVFKRVIAIDASPEQIGNAKPHAGVEYRVARAEQSGLEDASVDLVSVAQAAHWFDLDAFYAETRRVLRPGGVLALISYGVIEADGDVGRHLAHFYFDVIGRFWPAERRHVETGYRSLPFPFDEQPSRAMAMTADWSLNELLGYIDTWSAVRNAEAVLGRQPYERFASGLRAAWGDPQERREIRWPLSMRIGRV
jgi:DNA-binding transcriptional LysR family regulator